MSAYRSSIALACLSVAAVATHASAAVFTGTPSTATVINSASWMGGSFSGPGHFQTALGGFAPVGNWDGTWRSVVMLFQLPPGAIPAGHEVVSADFGYGHAYKNGANAPSYNLDLVAYRLDGQGFVTDGEFQAPGTVIQDDFITPVVGDFSFVQTSASGDANLVSYLNANYAAGSAGGTSFSWLGLRVQMDASGAPYESYMHNTYDGSLLLSFTTAPIPEPTTLGVMGLAAMTLVARRRH